MAGQAAGDLDGTRRLLYMALLAPRTRRYRLAGILVNALAHHQAIDLDTEEIMDKVVRAIAGGDSGSRDWVRDQIDRITAELGD